MEEHGGLRRQSMAFDREKNIRKSRRRLLVVPVTLPFADKP
jgi:hypothetical protein